MDILWPFLSVIAAIVLCGNLLVSQIYKIPGQYLVVGLRLLVLIVSLPIVFFIPAPDDLRFYIAVGLNGIIAGFSDIQTFNVAAKHGGGVVSRVLPFQIFIIFIMWLILHPEIIQEYIARPLNSAGILVALAGCVYFSSHMRKCSISNDAMKSLIFPLFGYAIGFVLAKYAFDHSPFHSGVYYYILFQTVVQLPCLLACGLISDKPFIKIDLRQLFTKTIFITAGFIFVFWMIHMIAKNYANTLTPNPSYVAALVLTTPVWMLIIYKIMGHREDANAKAGIGLTISAILLSILNLN